MMNMETDVVTTIPCLIGKVSSVSFLYMVFIFQEGVKSSEIISFAKSKDAPLVGEYDSETSEKAYKSKRPLVLFFCTVDWSFEHKEG